MSVAFNNQRDYESLAFAIFRPRREHRDNAEVQLALDQVANDVASLISERLPYFNTAAFVADAGVRRRR